MKFKIQNIRFLFQLLYLLVFLFGFLLFLPFLPFIILIFTIFGGAFFCGWLCPFGAIQEIINNISRIFNIPQKKVLYSIHKYLIFLRYIFLIVSLLGIGIVFFFDARVFFLDIISGTRLYLVSYILVGVFLILSFFYNRIFCSYFCIQGARYGLFSIFRVFRIQRNEKECINCKMCDKTCPMNIQISKYRNVNSLQCINCFLCVVKCPKKYALNYKLIKKDFFKYFNGKGLKKT
jgi:polyferredoxin